MDFKKINTETTCVTRQKDQFYVGTGNIYETVAIMAKRSDQIAAEMKEELYKKIEEYTTNNDSLEEIFENTNKSMQLQQLNFAISTQLCQTWNEKGFWRE